MNLPAETFRFMSPLDLHVLSTPPAFVLSQDQTLMFNPYLPSGTLRFDSPKPPLLPPRRASLSQNLTVLSFLLCIVFKVLSPPRFSSGRSYCITPPPFCQYLFFGFSIRPYSVFPRKMPLYVVFFPENRAFSSIFIANIGLLRIGSNCTYNHRYDE